MATREENLKKINEELEKLDDEQLDKVAGGSWWTDIKEEHQIQKPEIIAANYNPK